MEGESYDPKKAFEQYLKEKAGQPVDPRFEAAAKRELELGEKGGYAVYGDEPDRAEKFKNDPEGELFKTDLSIEELEKKLLELKAAREAIESFMVRNEPEVPGFNIVEGTFRDFRRAELPPVLRDASNVLVYYGFADEIYLSELTDELNETIYHDQAALGHLQRKAQGAQGY